MSNPPANTTAALWRFWEEFKAAEPDAVLGGIYAAKGGYHNTRDHHRAGIHRGSPDDYSIQRPADRIGPGNKASALDITFRTAQRGDYRIIAKYSKRLMAAGKSRDKRFYDTDGDTAIVREFFGNVADDGKVDGWSWYRERSASSDPSHLWHIHLSITRAYVDNWSKLAPILGVLLGRDINTPEDDMPLSEADARLVAKHVWEHNLKAGGAAPLAGWPADFDAPARGYLVGKDAAQTAILRNQAAMIKTLGAIATKVDALDEELGAEIREAIAGAQFVADIDVIQEEEARDV